MKKKMDMGATVIHVISIFIMVCVTSLHVGRSVSQDTFIFRLTNTEETKDDVKGLLEVRQDKMPWMKICIDWTDVNDDNVKRAACRQMGYVNTMHTIALASALLTDVSLLRFNCPAGNETNIYSCTHVKSATKCRPLRKGDTKSVVMVAKCKKDAGQYGLLNVTLQGGDVNSGTLEFTHSDGTTTPVCYDDRAESVASVVCKQMGYRDMVNASHVASSASKYVNLDCTESEMTLAACTFKNNATCHSGGFLAIECKLNTTSQNFFDVRLSSPDNSASQGTVEIWKYGRWGVLCDQDWTIEDANVVCRQLGYRSATDPLINAMYGQGSGVVFWDKVNCTGHEFSIAECPHSIAASTATCDSTKAAGVNCDTINPLTSNYMCTNETTSISIPGGYSFLRFPDRFSYEKETTCSCQSTNLTATTNISLYIQKKMFKENHVESLTFYDNWTLYGDNSSAGPFHFTETDNFAIQFKSDTSAGEGKLNILIKASDEVAFTCSKAAIDIKATPTTGTSVGPGKETPVVIISAGCILAENYPLPSTLTWSTT